MVACAHCKAEFEPKNSRGRFCSDRCRAAAWQAGQVRLKAVDLREIRALLQTGLESLWEAKVRLEKSGGGV